jgi:hypothetical protein
MVLVTLWAAASARTQPAPADPDAAQGEVIDRIVAVVQGVEDGKVITRSDLEFEAAVALILQRGAMRASDRPLDDEALRAALDYAIAQRLLTAEAERVSAFQLEDGEVEDAVRAFEQRFDSPAAVQRFLDRHDMDRPGLREVLRRSLRADRVLETRVRLRAQVTEAEVRRYYDQHQQELPGTFEELRPALREKLLRERYAQQVAVEVAQLRKRADVRLIAPPGGEGREEEPP